MEWQPIETLKKGVSVLVARAGQNSVMQAMKIDDETYYVGIGCYYKNPTHWMPLPPPPTS